MCVCERVYERDNGHRIGIAPGVSRPYRPTTIGHCIHNSRRGLPSLFILLASLLSAKKQKPHDKKGKGGGETGTDRRSRSFHRLTFRAALAPPQSLLVFWSAWGSGERRRPVWCVRGIEGSPRSPLSPCVLFFATATLTTRARCSRPCQACLILSGFRHYLLAFPSSQSPRRLFHRNLLLHPLESQDKDGVSQRRERVQRSAIGLGSRRVE